MNRLSAIDEPIELARLLSTEDLSDVVASAAAVSSLPVVVRDPEGVVLSSSGPVDRAGAVRSEPLVHNGEVVGEIVVGPAADTELDRASALALHLRRVLELLVHAAYARELTTTVHSTAIEEAFDELSDRNKRLAAAEERLEEVDRLKGQFLATISHELRTPLTSVIGYAEMLLEGLAGELSGEQREYVDTILGKADHLLQLITGILDVSLIEARSFKLARRPVPMLELIEGVATTLVGEAGRRGVVIELPKEEPMPRALGDAPKLRQVVLHLLANALKFSPQGGDVRVELGVGPLSPKDRSTVGSPFWIDRLGERFGLRLAVTDSGIGIDPKKVSRIFEPFFQADQSSTREYGGTGLGLSLAKSYVEAHGGNIWVESRPGEGSTFTVSLPAVGPDLESFVAALPGRDPA